MTEKTNKLIKIMKSQISIPSRRISIKSRKNTVCKEDGTSRSMSDNKSEANPVGGDWMILYKCCSNLFHASVDNRKSRGR